MKFYKLTKLIFDNYLNGYKSLVFKREKLHLIVSNLSKLLFNLLALVFLIVARLLYIKSLLGCDGEEFKCVLNNSMKYILDDIHYCILSVFYFLCFLFLFHLKLCSFYQLIFFLLIIFELIYRDTGDSFLHHGILNLSALFILLFFGELINFLLILFIFLLMRSSMKKPRIINIFI